MRPGWKENAVALGRIVGTDEPFELSAEERRTHTYISGASGKGKSKLIDLILRRDIQSWPRHRCGMLLIDFHGDLYNGVMGALASRMPWRLAEALPIVPIDLTRDDYTICYNPLRQVGEMHADTVISDLVRGMAYVWGDRDTNKTPRFERVATNTLYALYELGYTLADAPHLLDLDNPLFREQVAVRLKGIAAGHWQRAVTQSPKRYEEEAESSVNRFQRFARNPRLRTMFGVPGVTFDFEKALDEGHIVLVNLSSQGGWGAGQQANTVATLMLSDLWAAAERRGKDTEKLRPFRVVIDEFQRCVTPTIAANFDQARGFGLSLMLSSQSPTQLLDQGEIGKAIFRSVNINASNKIVFQQRDAESMELLADQLYIQTLDPMRVKFDLYATKVLGQEIVELRSRSSTSVSSTTEVEGESSSETVEGEDIREGHSTSDTESSSLSESESVAEALASVFGTELSSREFMSIEEQKHLAMQKIRQLKRQHALVMGDNLPEPVMIRVDDVKPATVGESYIKEYAAGFIKRLPFALPTSEASKRIAEHRAQIADQQAVVLAEPTTAKRRI
jgi:hypothetical protein